MTNGNPFDNKPTDEGIPPRKVNNETRFMIAEELQNMTTKVLFLNLCPGLWGDHSMATTRAQRGATDRALDVMAEYSNIRWTGRMYTIEVLSVVELNVGTDTTHLKPNVRGTS